MAANGISTETGANPVATKLLRRSDKLALATTKRSTAGNGYRTLHTISGTHTAYVGTTTNATVSGTASPSVGHPWI